MARRRRKAGAPRFPLHRADLPLGSHTIPVREASALSLPGVAEIINDAIVALDLSDVTLVGSDTGGGLCQLVVDAHPDRIGRLVLTNCDAFDKCPPFPFDMVFGVLRGPISIKALFGPCGCGRCGTRRSASAC